ncbi:MAG: hypothetical protein VXB94_10870 [Rhodobiaceae bacterium]|jgi:hypothetical protein
MAIPVVPAAYPSAGAPMPGSGVDSRAIGASSVPNGRQTGTGLVPVQTLERSDQDYRRRMPMITSPRLAPSAISTEQALQARSLLTPEFQHNVMATRILRTSNLHAETPRFRSQLDILA